MMALYRVAILVTDGVQSLDVSGPADVFAEANVQTGRDAYEVRILAACPGPVRTSSGLRLGVDDTLGGAAQIPIDTLLVAGAPHLHRRARDGELLSALREIAIRARRFGSVCTGAVLLAEAGLLDGRRATTHWAIADEFARSFPQVMLEMDAIHVRDGPARTSAGVTAGLDLALSLVEEDLGLEVARRVAAQLVMYFRRPGGQIQHSRAGQGSPGGRSVIQNLQRWILANPAERHSVADLATRTGLSPRHFARLFRAEVGVTPAAWVEGARVEAARRKLEEGQPPKMAGAASGFGDVDTFRRAFRRRLGVSPATYRSNQSP